MLEAAGERLQAGVVTLVSIADRFSSLGNQQHEIFHLSCLLTEISLCAVVPGLQVALGVLLRGDDLGGLGLERERLLQSKKRRGKVAGGGRAEIGVAGGGGGKEALIRIEESREDRFVLGVQIGLQG